MSTNVGIGTIIAILTVTVMIGIVGAVIEVLLKQIIKELKKKNNG